MCQMQYLSRTKKGLPIAERGQDMRENQFHGYMLRSTKVPSFSRPLRTVMLSTIIAEMGQESNHPA